MATIRPRKKVDGTISYTAQIRINRDKVTVYQESQTFARKQAAVAWAKRRETELVEPGAIERASRPICVGEGMGIKAGSGWIRSFRHRLNSVPGLSRGGAMLPLSALTRGRHPLWGDCGQSRPAAIDPKQSFAEGRIRP